jgi:O-antigen/teichoic acid export membrane protein
MKAYLKWGIPLTPSAAIQWIISSSDRYIVSYFRGVSATGIYNAADVIGGYASFAFMPVGIVLFPMISKNYDEGKQDQCKDYLKYSFKYLMMFAIPCAVGLSILAKPLLRILTTSEFISGSAVLVLATIGGLFTCLYQIVIYIIYLAGKTQIDIVLMSIAAGLNILLNVVLVPHLGIVGAETASVIAYAVLGGLGLIMSRKYLKFNMSFSFLIKCALSSGFMALCIWLINPRSSLMVSLSIVAGTIAYFGILILIRGFSKSELAFFTTFIRKSFKEIVRGGH